MTERLAKGQNVVWAAPTCVVRVEASVPVDVSALLLGANGKVRTDSDFVFYNNPSGPGVRLGSSGDITMTLPAVQAVSVMCLVSVDPGAQPLGSHQAPRVLLSGPDQLPELEFIIAGLTTERAVLTFELYRRGHQWKVRAIGQGYSGGLAAAVADHGREVEQPPPAPVMTPPPPHLVAPAPPGTTEQERLHRLIGSIFEDAARSTAGMRSATSFANRRRDSELSEALADPSTRNTAVGAAAREQAEQRFRTLMDKAQSDHRRDVAQLLAELRDLELKLPAPMLDWTAASWQSWKPPAERNLAIRGGSLTVPEAPDLRLPLMVGVPLARPLWIDSAGALNQGNPGAPDSAAEFFIPDTPEELFSTAPSRVDPLAMARALITRILATSPTGGIKLLMADLAGRGAAAEALKPLGAVGCRVFDAPVATTPDELGVMIDDCVNFVDLGQMALQGGMPGPDAGRLLVITNFPYGLDDAQIGKLRYLVDEGVSAGLGLIVIGDHSEAQGRGPMVTSLFRSFMRLPVEPDSHLGDAWTGTTWTFTPDAGPADQQIQTTILAQISGRLR